MKVLILSGSIGKRSLTRTLLRHIETLLKKRGIEPVFWDLAQKSLPMAVPEYHTNQDKHPNKVVREFVKAVREADAYILGSPLYHDSYSGVLKNAMDNLPNEAFLHKPVGLVSHSSNVRSCVAPCNQLRPVVRSLGGYSAHIQVGTTDADYKEVAGKLVLADAKVKNRLEELIQEILVMVTAKTQYEAKT